MASTRKTTGAKPATRSKTAKKAAPAKTTASKAAAGPTPVPPPADAMPEEVQVTLRRKEFLQRVAARAGLRPNQVRPVLDAVLEELGQTIDSGQPLNLPPLGKLGLRRRKDRPNSAVSILRLRRKKPEDSDAEPIAAPGE